MARFKQIDRRLLTILLIVFVQMLGASMALPILPLYAQRVFQMDERVIPLLISVFFAAQFIAGPTIGRLSDRYGRVPVLIVSQVGTVIAFAMLGSAASVPILFFARILDGITGGNIIVAQAYVTDITPDNKRTQSLGYVFAAFGLGFIFGPGLGGLLSAQFGPRAPFWFAALAATLVVLLTIFTLNETLSPEERAQNRQRGSSSNQLSLTAIGRNIPLLIVLIFGFFTQFSFGLIQSTFSLWGEAVLFAEYDQGAVDLGIGLLLSTVGLGQLITQVAILPRLLKRFDDATLVVIGSIGRLLGNVVFALITVPWLGPIGAILFAFGAGVTNPALQSLATRAVDESGRGEVLGIVQSVNSVGIILSTAVAGLVFAYQPNLQFWIAAGLVFVLLGPALSLQRQFAKQKSA